MQIDVPNCSSISLRSVSRICIIIVNAVKNSHISRKRIVSWNGQSIWLVMRTLWKAVITLDETKFNIYGPDGCHYYWHELEMH